MAMHDDDFIFMLSTGHGTTTDPQPAEPSVSPPTQPTIPPPAQPSVPPPTQPSVPPPTQPTVPPPTQPSVSLPTEPAASLPEEHVSAPPAQLDVDDLPIVKRYLRDLGRDELIDLGVELGLRYPNIQLMTSLKNEMVTAWLKSEDNVVRISGPPSWASLAGALRNINQNGIANTIDTGKRARYGLSIPQCCLKPPTTIHAQ